MLSSNPRIIIIHGLNNNSEAFLPLKQNLETKGIEVLFIILPCHGDERDPSMTFEIALQKFKEMMKTLTQEPYYVIAFSLGALYFQLWLEDNDSRQPLAQVLLAPALYLKKQNLLAPLFKRLPKFLFIPSQAPKKLRRYSKLYIWEYRILFEAMRCYQNGFRQFKIPTKIIMDPMDELVDGKEIQKAVTDHPKEFKPDLKLMRRKYLRGKRPGKYHIIFHPDYFSKQDWDELLKEIFEVVNP